MVSITPQLCFTPGKRPLYPLDKRLGEPRSRSSLKGCPCHRLNPGSTVRSQSLFWLNYPNSLIIRTHTNILNDITIKLFWFAYQFYLFEDGCIFTALKNMFYHNTQFTYLQNNMHLYMFYMTINHLVPQNKNFLPLNKGLPPFR